MHEYGARRGNKRKRKRKRDEGKANSIAPVSQMVLDLTWLIMWTNPISRNYTDQTQNNEGTVGVYHNILS